MQLKISFIDATRCSSDMKPPAGQRGQSLSRSLPDLMAEEKLIFSAFNEKGKSYHLYFIPNITYRSLQSDWGN